MNIPFLFSYHYIKATKGLHRLVMKILEDESADVIIDSGAFSAHRLGSPINLEEYTTFCRSISHYKRLWGCVQLDVVGNAAGTKENLKKTLDLGYTPMPVLTTTEPVEYIDELYKINKRICCAGNLGQFSGAVKWACDRHSKCSARLPEDARLHGLGFVRWPQMYQVGLSTVDSSSWVDGSRYGCLWMFDRSRGLVSMEPYRDVKGVGGGSLRPEYIKLLTDCGITLEDFKNTQLMASGQAISFCSLLTAYGSIWQSSFSRKRGLGLYLAVTSTNNMEIIYLAMKYGRVDGSSIDYHAARKEGIHIRSIKPWQDRVDYIAAGLNAVNTRKKKVW